MSRFKNLFFTGGDEIQDIPQPQPVVQSQQIKVPVETIATAAGTTINTIISSSSSGKINDKILDGLCSLMDSLNTGKSDYVLYKKSVDALKDYQSDEAARFLTAFVTLKPTNPDLTKEGLLDSLEQYIKAIQYEQDNVLKDLSNEKSDKLNYLEKIIDQQSNELAVYEQKVIDLKKSISDNSAQLLVKRSDFQNKENDFKATVAVVLDQLNSDKSKINAILK